MCILIEKNAVECVCSVSNCGMKEKQALIFVSGQRRTHPGAPPPFEHCRYLVAAYGSISSTGDK